MPSFTTHPENLTLKSGGFAELQCAADGTPAPTITWFKDGHSVVAGGRLSFSSTGQYISNVYDRHTARVARMSRILRQRIQDNYTYSITYVCCEFQKHVCSSVICNLDVKTWTNFSRGISMWNRVLFLPAEDYLTCYAVWELNTLVHSIQIKLDWHIAPI